MTRLDRGLMRVQASYPSLPFLTGWYATCPCHVSKQARKSQRKQARRRDGL